jgi:hypothetical protein
MLRHSAAFVLVLLATSSWPSAAAAPRSSVLASLVARDSIAIAGVGCGVPASATQTLPAGAFDVQVKQPLVGTRDLDAQITDVSIQGNAVTFTAVADSAAVCDPAEDPTPPADRPWSAQFDAEASFKQRVEVVLRNLFPLQGKRVAVRPRRVRIGLAGVARKIRWKRFGGPTAIGHGIYKSVTPCAGGCTDNGTRLSVKLTRPVHCPSDSQPGGKQEFVFYGKVAFVLRERLGVLKPGTEWISTRLKECPADGRKPVAVR